MASSADTLAPAGIGWEAAMNNAAEILASLTQRKMTNYTVWGEKAAAAQAWIAYAREITMHARAVQ